MNSGLQLIEKDICSKICDRLNKVGLLYRIFSRVKDNRSIEEKIERKKAEGEPYSKDGKKMQDIIGIRIVTYFYDDVNLVKEIIANLFQPIGEEIDKAEPTVFKPKRTNIICAFDEKQRTTIEEVVNANKNDNYKLIDYTFELQLRTILSEGWHEIDHSLRYKCKSEWGNHSEKERLLNGIYATLEVNDLALKSLFSELAYQHFKEKNWEAMLRHKFRLQFQLVALKDELKQILDEDYSVAKQLLKLDRSNILNKLSKFEIPLPINFNNIIYFINQVELKNESINQITPISIKINQ
jgi:putative GTP pyrophosphokinase